MRTMSKLFFSQALINSMELLLGYFLLVSISNISSSLLLFLAEETFILWRYWWLVVESSIFRLFSSSSSTKWSNNDCTNLSLSISLNLYLFASSFWCTCDTLLYSIGVLFHEATCRFTAHNFIRWLLFPLWS